LADPDNTIIPPDQSQPQQGLPSGVLPQITTQGGVLPLSSSDFLKKTHADTAKTLSFWLVGILAGTVLLHYVCVMILVLLKRDYAVSVIEDILHVWLPVLAGLAGSAATYYFTRDKS
jgi:hypothetical protein